MPRCCARSPCRRSRHGWRASAATCMGRHRGRCATRWRSKLRAGPSSFATPRSNRNKRHIMTNRILASLLLLLASTAAAQADSYPSHPLRLLQGFAPGGNVDNVARVLAAEMQKGLGQPVIVESKVGAGGNVAADVVAKSSPDGYTLLLAAGAHPASAVLYQSLNFRPVRDLAWIFIASTYPFVGFIPPDSAIRGLPDLLPAAPGKAGAVFDG